MSRLQSYINEDRSKAMNQQKAFEWIRKNATDALKMAKKGNLINRGVNIKQDALIINPSKVKSPRRSAYAGHNYYTLLLDNLPSWKQYPKRSESIICSTDRSKADGYGTVYIVFPKNGSRIGVASEKDIFFSFKLLQNKTKTTSLGTWINKFVSIDSAFTEGSSDKNWKTMINLFREIDDAKKTWSEEELKFTLYDHDFLAKKGKTIDLLDKVFHPGRNGFKVQTIGASLLPYDREVWTDGESVMLSKESFDILMQQEKSDVDSTTEISFIPNYNISHLDIFYEDLFQAYSDVYNPKNRRGIDDTVAVVRSPVRNGEEWFVYSGHKAIVKALMQGKTKINLDVDWTLGKDYYHHGEELFKYKSSFKYKGLENFSNDDRRTAEEDITDDAKEWGFTK